VGTVCALVTLSSLAACSRPPSPRVDKTVRAPTGFDVELVHEVDPETQGSWVALCSAPDGTLYAADQQDGLFRITPPALKDYESPTRVERVDIELKGAQGLLYWRDALYAMATGKGVVRMTDTDGDGEVDSSELIVEAKGAGEHGTHAIVPHPDGQSLLIVAGNHTPLPKLTASRVPQVWGEDQLLTRDGDPRGHANGVMAPGGWVCRMSADGSEVELITCGFRNSYDVAVDRNGEIFTYDSDMEWDLGLPWYRPARVCHVVSGADYGWRFGSGKWPEYYEDSLPPVVDIGPGSPTGMLFGTGARFPAKYQRAMYMLDWTYGIIYAVHLEPSGASYTAEVEQFVVGKPLPLTDAAIGDDGAMYFATGGRGLASKLYRIVYRGGKSTAPVSGGGGLTPGAELRRKLAKAHASPIPLDEIWPHLGSDDRFVRHAARIALERLPVDQWRERALSEPNPGLAIPAMIALARHGEASDRDEILSALLRIDPQTIEDAQRLALLRAMSLTLTRLTPESPGSPGAPELVEYLETVPADSADVDAEVTRLLVALESPAAIDRALRAMHDTSAPTPPSWADLARQNDQYGGAITGMLDRPPPTRALRYAHFLSNIPADRWTFQQLQSYFTFLQRARAGSGGMSYAGYIDTMQKRVLSSATEHQLAALEPLLQPLQSSEDAPVVFPEGPYRPWTVERASRAVGTLRLRDFDRGAGLYRATTCITCHQFNGEGNNVGPDLTSVGSTYSTDDLLRAIIEPSHAITDQYAISVATKTSGEQISGLIVESTEDHVVVAPNFTNAAFTTTIPRSEIASIELSPVSPMPEGLVNPLNENELRDLIAYLISAGDRSDPMFKQ